MDIHPRYTDPTVDIAAEDERLTVIEKHTVTLLWIKLSPKYYMPMKAEALGFMLGVRRQTASRILRRLIECGYLETFDPPDRSQPRLYLLRQVRPLTNRAA